MPKQYVTPAYECAPSDGGYPVVEQNYFPPEDYTRQVEQAWERHDRPFQYNPVQSDLYAATVSFFRTHGELRRDGESVIKPAFNVIRKQLHHSTRFSNPDLRAGWEEFSESSMQAAWQRAQQIGPLKVPRRRPWGGPSPRRYEPYKAPAGPRPERTDSYLAWGDMQRFYQQPFIDQDDDIHRRYETRLTHLPHINQPFPSFIMKDLMHDVVILDEMPQLPADQTLEEALGYLPAGTPYVALLPERNIRAGISTGEQPKSSRERITLSLGETTLLNAMLLHAAIRGGAADCTWLRQMVGRDHFKKNTANLLKKLGPEGPHVLTTYELEEQQFVGPGQAAFWIDTRNS